MQFLKHQANVNNLELGSLKAHSTKQVTEDKYKLDDHQGLSDGRGPDDCQDSEAVYTMNESEQLPANVQDADMVPSQEPK